MSSVSESFLAQPLHAISSGPLRALWHSGHGEWVAAHEEAQQGKDSDSAWVHALLHRHEGDQWNAEYWYKKAGKPVYAGPIETERTTIITTLLKEGNAV